MTADSEGHRGSIPETRRSLAISVTVGALLTACTGSADSAAVPLDPRLDIERPALAEVFGGDLVVTHFDGDAGESGPNGRYQTVFVPGESSIEMEDNDLRGFLDGVFKWGWNQPGQMHVRFGRRPGSPGYGENELFRVVQRWEGVEFPVGSTIEDASLVFEIEEGPDYPVRVFLYQVNRDWNPGLGGTQRDNVSPPSRGEVWWNGPRFGEESWGLPGVGYASPDADGDTPVTALAAATYQPDDSLLVFSDPGLAAYVQERSASESPLLFLLKVSDVQEDRPGSLVIVYSGNHGDSKNSNRRPRLEVEWTNPGGNEVMREGMLIEHGRRVTSEPIRVPPGGWLDMEFSGAADALRPLLEVRGGDTAQDTSTWMPASQPIENRWSWIQVRVSAFRNPVEIGTPFEFEVHDTWVVTGPPSQATVRAAFLAPSGRVHTATASYQGGYRWKVGFVPDEFGTWRYRWMSDFEEDPMVSAVGRFEVIAEDRVHLEAALEELVGDLRRATPEPGFPLLEKVKARLGMDGPDLSLLHRRFLGYERAALRLETPESFHSDSNEIRLLLKEARRELGGEPVPDSIPLVVSPSHRGRNEYGED